MTDVPLTPEAIEAVHAQKNAANAVELARAAEIAAAVEKGVKPIRVELEKQNVRFEEHREDVKLNREEVQKQIGNLATKDDLDVKFKKIENFIDGFNLTVKVGGIVSKYGMKTITVIVTLIISFGIITGSFKSILAAIANWAIK